jgi:hypothetical protein
MSGRTAYSGYLNGEAISEFLLVNSAVNSRQNYPCSK